MTNEILDLCVTRRNLKSVKRYNPGNIAKHRDINIKIRKLIISTKGQWINTRCKQIDEDMTYEIFSKRTYETLKALTKTPYTGNSQ